MYLVVALYETMPIGIHSTLHTGLRVPQSQGQLHGALSEYCKLTPLSLLI